VNPDDSHGRGVIAVPATPVVVCFNRIVHRPAGAAVDGARARRRESVGIRHASGTPYPAWKRSPMATRQGFQELVVLFDGAGSKVDLEMRYGQFNGLLAQKGTLNSHVGATVKAAYAQVGAGLSVRAAVFFLFKVGGQGYVDPAFNLPLEYMAEHAGEGPDLGSGVIKMACRSQCPVPWHAINMWEPTGEKQSHPAMLVQKVVWRNRLGLKPIPMARRGDSVTTLLPRAAQHEQGVVQAVAQVDEAVNLSVAMPRMRAQMQAKIQARVQAMEEKLTAAFGRTGRIAQPAQPARQREQVGQLTARFRLEMERQQQGYLEQIKNCREEIQKLKATLRHEQERNRRLQQLLRGDV
jgi:hypothetical protein